jgi:hypothetical protein
MHDEIKALIISTIEKSRQEKRDLEIRKLVRARRLKEQRELLEQKFPKLKLQRKQGKP